MSINLKILLKQAAMFGVDRASDSSTWWGGGGQESFEDELNEQVPKWLEALSKSGDAQLVVCDNAQLVVCDNFSDDPMHMSIHRWISGCSGPSLITGIQAVKQ